MKKINLSLFSICFFFSFSFCMESPPAQDPLARMNYDDAFNQAKIFKKFRRFLNASNCAENVFGNELEPIRMDNFIDTGGELTWQLTENDQQAFEKSCLKQLKSARNWALTEQARESLTLLALLVSATVLATKMLSSDSLGGSFSVFALLFNSVFLLREIVRSGYNFVFPPDHALNTLEENFAKNKCYIPKELWAVLTDKFKTARRNQFEQQKSSDFIEFALGFTIYKPKPEVAFKDNSSSEQVIKELHLRVDLFFNDYDKFDKKYSWDLKINIYKFVQCLINYDDQASRYICLQGPAGIGKTHFINKLYAWMEELIPGAVRLEELVITNADELEGSSNRAGAILQILRNQSMENKQGSLVFMDEATWLNKDDMYSPAKRVFNVDQSKLSTTYFTGGLGGAGIILKMPPMLIFVALNEDIKEAALKSRFDCLAFPWPKKQALHTHALDVVQKSKILMQIGIIPSEDEISNWIETLEEKNRNFRYIAGNVESFLLGQSD